MPSVKGPSPNATIKHVIEQSLTSAKPLFVLSALPDEEMTAVHEALYTAWDRLRHGQRKKVVRDLAVTEFSLPWSERPALSFYNRCRACSLLQAYLTDSCSQAELRKLSLARNLTTEDRYLLLQHVWQHQRGFGESQAVEEHTRLWLGVDEVETILEYTAREQRDLARGLTHLISSTGYFLTVWLNVSEESRDVIARTSAAFGSKLWEFLDEDLTEREEGQNDSL